MLEHIEIIHNIVVDSLSGQLNRSPEHFGGGTFLIHFICGNLQNPHLACCFWIQVSGISWGGCCCYILLCCSLAFPDYLLNNVSCLQCVLRI